MELDPIEIVMDDILNIMANTMSNIESKIILAYLQHHF